jgi:hypothetical protein
MTAQPNVTGVQSFVPSWGEMLAQVESPAPIGQFEPFVDEHVVARFLQITSRRVLEEARKGEIPAHPIGRKRKTWRFKISEIDAHFSALKKPARATMATAVPGTHGRKRG